MKFLVAFVLMLGICVAPSLEAQQVLTKKIKLEALTIKDGLSQGMVNAIIQDRTGFMWFGTKDGLNRYDGKNFTVFRHAVNDTNSIAENYIQCLYEDKRGRIWVGTVSHGLDLFDPETEKFRHITPVSHPGFDLGHSLIDAVLEDNKGRYWVATAKALICLEEKAGARKGRTDFDMTVVDTGLCNIYKQHNGTIWVFNSTSTYTLDHSGPEPMQRHYVQFTSASKPLNGPAEVRTKMAIMVEDTAKQQLWIGSTGCFYRYDLRSKQVASRLPYPQTLGEFVLKTAACMRDQFWFIADHNLFILDVLAGQVYLPEHDFRAHGDIMTSASCLYKDKSGVLWIGTAGFGVYKFRSRTERFHFIPCNSMRGISAFAPDKIILYGISNHLTWYDIHQNQFGVFPAADNARLYGFTGPIRVADKQGHVWFTKDSMLRYMDRDGRILKEIPIPVRQFSTIALQFNQCLYQDAEGFLWLGTTAGLFRYDPATASWTHFANAANDPGSLSFDVIFSICPDPANPDFLYVGTSGGGFNHFNKRTGRCTRYSSRNGLPNDVVYGILSDQNGYLWMSTNYGLSKFDPTHRKFYNFLEEDGLQSNEFNRNSSCKLDNGTLVFGGINGFNYFRPGEIVLNSVSPNIVITDFRLRNKSISHTDRNSPIDKPIHFIRHITLPYKENMIGFEFAVMDYAQINKNRYEYKLVGFDENWIQSGNNNSATYTNLDPGTYTLYVKGCNNDGVWTVQPRSLLLTILPPWYMTWWFRLGVLLSVAALVYAFYRYRLRQALAVQEIRNHIAQDLHDEIGSNLSSIYIFSDMASRKTTGGDDEAGKLLLKIREYTSTSMEAMSDIVWMLNTRNDGFDKILARMRHYAAELGEAKHYQLHIDFDEATDKLQLHMESRKNFYLIYKEAINNAMKYANGQNVWISLKLIDDLIHLQIRDDGIGFDTETEGHGNGLHNMKKRAEALQGKLSIASARNEGSRITLVFPYAPH